MTIFKNNSCTNGWFFHGCGKKSTTEGKFVCGPPVGWSKYFDFKNHFKLPVKKKLKLYLVGCSWIFFIPQSGALGRSQLAMIGVDWGRSNGSEKWKEFWWIINRSFADTGFSIVLLRSRRLSIKKHNILKTCSRDAPLAGTASQQVRSQQHARDVPRTFITRKPDKMKDMKDYESKIRQTWENTID